MNRDRSQHWTARPTRCLVASALTALLGCSEHAPDASGSLPTGATDPADAGGGAGTAAADASGASASSTASNRGCGAAERLVPTTLSARSLLHADGSTLLAADTNQSELAGCRDFSSGPDRWYSLDLSGFTRPVEVQAVVDASFDAVLELRRGACGDTASLDCDRAQSIAATGSSIAASLEPDLYWLIVDGASPASSGEFRLQIEVDPTPDQCTDTPAAGSCGMPLPLEPLPRQTLLLDEACLPQDDDDYRDTHAWYQLDLSGESRAVLVHASAWTLSAATLQSLYLYDATDQVCDSELAFSFLSRGLGRTNAELNALLAPGRYQLRLDSYGGAERRAGIEIEIDRDTCQGGPVANECADAIVIDPGLPRQLLAGNTACNTSRFQPYCAEVDAPEQFYRLDLRSAPGPVRTRVTTLVDGLGFSPILALLSAENDGVCPDPVYCDTRIGNDEGPPRLDLTLDPQLYYVVIDGTDPSAGGPYQMLVELEPAERSPCVDARIDDCMYANSQADCCHDWSPACDASVELCGLARATQQCVCAMAPDCCGPLRDGSACHDAEQACNYLCPDFAPSADFCLSPAP